MGSAYSYQLWTGLLLTTAAGGCTLTPAPQPPGMVDDIIAAERYTQDRSGSIARADTARWWTNIGGNELDTLVNSLVNDSLLVKEARLQAEQAIEGARISRGQRLPSVTAVGDVSTTRTRGLTGDYSWSESYTTSLLADFNTDIFGGLRASERAAELNAAASELSIEATLQREIALLARNWVSAATLQRRLELAIRTADSFRSTYELTDERYSAGSTSVTASDVQIALQNLEAALIDIPQIEADFTQQLIVIDEQLARLPGTTEVSFSGDYLFQQQFSPPVGTPADLVSRRPDVAIAELRYLAALEDVGAARARLYPALSLSASLTFQSDDVDDLFDWDRHIASLANSLTAPVFQGGRLRAQVRLEQARATELATAFSRAALAAVVDVEIALAELTGLEEQRARLDTSLATAALSNELAQGRYRQGLSSILAVLETQRSLDAAEQNVILTDQAIANAQIDLFLSLGGDWAVQNSTAEMIEPPLPNEDR